MMKHTDFVKELPLRRELKELLYANGIFTVEDFSVRAVGVLKEIFEVTLQDWCDILDVFAENRWTKRISEDVVCAALMPIKKSDGKSPNALLINVLGEKYVVSLIRNGKGVYRDFLYKSLSRGIVFQTKEDAVGFAEMIREWNGSKIVEATIDRIPGCIHVVHAHAPIEEKSALYFGETVLHENILKMLRQNDVAMKRQRGNHLAKKAVERINRLFGKEVALLTAMECDGQGALSEVPFAEAEPEIYGDGIYLDVRRYVAEIERLICKDGDGYFNLGKNAALTFATGRSIAGIRDKIAQYEQALVEYAQDAGVTEEDIAFAKGYLEGARDAITVQKKHITDQIKVRVALLDQFGVLEQAQMPSEMLCVPITDGKCVVELQLFDKMEDLQAVCKNYNGVYLLNNGGFSHEETLWACEWRERFQREYEMDLRSIRLGVSFRDEILQDALALPRSTKEDKKEK